MALPFLTVILVSLPVHGRLLQESTTAATTSSTPTPTTPDPTALQGTCDAYCQQLNGEQSYCKTTLAAPACLGGDQPCDSFEACGQSIPLSTAPIPSTGDGTYEPACDTMCQSLNDEASYCKWWLPKPTCLGGDQPCGDQTVCTSQTWPPAPTPSLPAGAHPHESAPCNAYCVSLNGEGSYCKWWKEEPTCQGGNQSCGVGDCPTGTQAPTGGPADTHSAHSPACDDYCVSQNQSSDDNSESYCKWWLTVPTCLYGDQHCGPSVCEGTSPAP
ncbi:hypothetical protein FOZ62_027074 [Perkinsus olseni]|uniref:Immunoglobulin super DCC subclass member n=1 Tax=Perkinsus olseni TaxID=32597 RepID=A0A7J6PBC7_PEROL|nr:hypothetical protein FOZ62_027074 [Perkinsus olseni]